MHQAGEREQQEDRHAQHKMRLEDRMHIQNVGGDAGLQRQDALRPPHEFYHFMTVEMSHRDRDGRQPQQ